MKKKILEEVKDKSKKPLNKSTPDFQMKFIRYW